MFVARLSVTARQANPHAPAATPEHVARLLSEASVVTTVETSGQIEIQLGHFCNNRCVFCASGQLTEQGKADPVPEPAVARALQAAAQKGMRRVTFLGGEPTIQDSFLPSLQLARQLGFAEITIFTNGSRTWDERFLAAALSDGPCLWRISVQGGDGPSHDAAVGKAGAFARIIRGLKLLQQRKQDVTVNMCLTAGSVASLPLLAPLLIDHGVRQLCIDMIRPVSAGERTAAWMQAILPRFSEVVPAVRQLLADLDRLAADFDVNITHVPFCVLPGQAHRLHHGGEPTITFTADLAERQGAMDKYAFQASDRRHMPQCTQCVFRPRCTGVPHQYLDWFGETEFVAVTPEALPTVDPQNSAFVDALGPWLATLPPNTAVGGCILAGVIADPRARRVELRLVDVGSLWLLPAGDALEAGLWHLGFAKQCRVAVEPGRADPQIRSAARALIGGAGSAGDLTNLPKDLGDHARRWLEATEQALADNHLSGWRTAAMQWRRSQLEVTGSYQGKAVTLRAQPHPTTDRPLHMELLQPNSLTPADSTQFSAALGRLLRATRPVR